jgi:flagellar motor switch protein FliN/FliY
LKIFLFSEAIDLSSTDLTEEKINQMIAGLVDGQGHQIVQRDKFMPLQQVNTGKSVESSINFLKNVSVSISVELGKCHLSIREILGLKNGSVLRLDKMAGEPVEILVNNLLLARGEVLIINDVVGVRVNTLVDEEKK